MIAIESDLVTDRRKQIRKEVDRVLDIKDEKERLRQAFKLWLTVNPKIEVSYSDGARAWVTAKVAYKQTLEKIRYLKEQHETDLGISADKKRSHRVGDMGWRGVLEFPPGSIEFMRMFAMDLFMESGQEQKKAAMKLSKVFPQFVVPEKL